MRAVHISPFAGSWYPEEPAELERLTAELFERSVERTGPCALRDAVAFVVPHAGLTFSGTVASAAYRTMAESRPSRIVLLGFAHGGGPRGVAIPAVERIATPGGEVAVDRGAARALAGMPSFRTVEERLVCDHSVEIQLPLLLKAAPGVPVLPLYVGAMNAQERDAAAAVLAALAETNTVFLASSDFTHYGRSFRYQPFPPDDRLHDRLRDLDFGIVEAAGSLDPELFLDHVSSTGATVCGYQPLALLLAILRVLGGGEIFQETLDYRTSADITGDVHHSVSYAALGYFRARSFELEPVDRELLLESASGTLRNLLESGARRPAPPKAVTPALARRAGAFVSLHEGSRLRGCVGHRCGRQPLAEAIPALTLAAALDDTRFSPVREACRPIGIEISVLTPFRRLRDASGFVLGRHGLLLESGAHCSLLLPQVVRGLEWSAEDFLSALAHKAGLPADGWAQPGVRLYAFQAQVFSREKALPARA